MEQQEKLHESHHIGHHKKAHELQHHAHHEKRKALSKSFYTKICVVFGLALIFFSAYGIYQASSLNALFDEKLEEAKEAARPAEIQLITISTPSCDGCYDINAVVEVIESTGANVTSKKEIEFKSSEAQSFIDKYNIEKLPTVIVTGEVNKSKTLNNKLKQMSKEESGAYIFTKLEPPFIDSATGSVRGKISLIHLKKEDCEDCVDIEPFISQLVESGLKFEEQRTVDAESVEGKKLIGKYEIKKLPTIIMDRESEVYPTVIDNWEQIGSIENDGYLVMRELTPPYYDVEEGRLKGLILMTVLTDESCGDCYDPNTFHKPIIQRMGVVFGEEKEVDISSEEGQELINKYNITNIPTIILTGDVEEYSVLVNAWRSVGTEESDGTYVFRRVEVAGKPYKDLITNEIVDPAAIVDE